MNKQSLPVVSDLDKTSIEEFKTAGQVVVVAFHSKTSDDHKWKDTFITIAKSMQSENTFLFGLTEDAELAEAEGVSEGRGVVLYKQVDEGKVVHSGTLDQESIETFVRRASLSLLVEADRHLITAYLEVSRADRLSHEKSFIQVKCWSS